MNRELIAAEEILATDSIAVERERCYRVPRNRRKIERWTRVTPSSGLKLHLNVPAWVLCISSSAAELSHPGCACDVADRAFSRSENRRFEIATSTCGEEQIFQSVRCSCLTSKRSRSVRTNSSFTFRLKGNERDDREEKLSDRHPREKYRFRNGERRSRE